MVVRKGSNLKTYRYFGIFKSQPISHFLQMMEVRDVGEMRELHRPEPHQHISQRLDNSVFVRHTVYRVGRPLAVAKVPQQE